MYFVLSFHDTYVNRDTKLRKYVRKFGGVEGWGKGIEPLFTKGNKIKLSQKSAQV